MGQAPRYRTLRDYLVVIRTQRIVIVACVVLFGGIAAAVTFPQTPEYEAEASLNFQDLQSQSSLLGNDSPPASGTQQTTGTVNAQFVESPSVARLAARKLRLRSTTKALLSHVNADPEASTGFVVIRSQSTNAVEAAALANAFAQAADEIKTRREKRHLDKAAAALRRETKKTTPKNDTFSQALQGERIARINALADFAQPVEIAKAAEVPSSPASPKVMRTILLGLLVGLVVGIIVGFIRDVLDTRVRAPADVRRATNLPLLGVVSHSALGQALSDGTGRGGTAERDRDAFRIVRTNLDFLSPDRPVRTVAVTSAVAGEGKSSVAAALAQATAAVGRAALLVECDLRRPQLASRLGADPTPGLSELLASRAMTGEAIRHLQSEGSTANGARLDFLPVGDTSETSLESLGSDVLADLLAVLSRSYDLVILDTAPILPVADTLQMLPRVDAVVLCARASRTTRDELRSAREALDRFAPRPCGVVLTGVRSKELGSYGNVYAAAEPVPS